MKHSQHFFWLDVVRGLSALIVCTGHLRAMLFVDYPNLQAPSFFQTAFYAVTGLGHQAVIVFFVLSGFFVGGSVLKKSSNFEWREYLISRLSRLWIVLIPALVVTFSIDQLILLIMPNILDGSYYSLWSSGPSLNKTFSNNWLTFLGNIFFLQTILTPVFGTNSPLWSLANEFWYYILFPICAFATGNCYKTKKPHLFLRVIAALIAATFFILLPSNIQSGYFIWLLGVAIYIIFQRLNKMSFPLLAIGMIMFGVALVYSKSTYLQTTLNIPTDLLVGIGFSSFCVSIVNLPVLSDKYNFFTKAFCSLSNISYSLYLTHFPIVILFGALFYTSNQLLPNVDGFSHFVSLLALLLLVSIIFWSLFEKNTYKLKTFMTKRLIR